MTQKLTHAGVHLSCMTAWVMNGMKSACGSRDKVHITKVYHDKSCSAFLQSLLCQTDGAALLLQHCMHMHRRTQEQKWGECIPSGIGAAYNTLSATGGLCDTLLTDDG